MATKLDRNFVKTTLDGVLALASDLERCECYCAELEARLDADKIAQASEAASKKWLAMGEILS